MGRERGAKETNDLPAFFLERHERQHGPGVPHGLPWYVISDSCYRSRKAQWIFQLLWDVCFHLFIRCVMDVFTFDLVVYLFALSVIVIVLKLSGALSPLQCSLFPVLFTCTHPFSPSLSPHLSLIPYRWPFHPHITFLHNRLQLLIRLFSYFSLKLLCCLKNTKLFLFVPDDLRYIFQAYWMLVEDSYSSQQANKDWDIIMKHWKEKK